MSSYENIDYESTELAKYKLQEKMNITDAWREEEFKNKRLIPFCSHCFNRAYAKSIHSLEREDYCNMQLLEDSKPVASFNRFKEKTIEIYREWKCRRCGHGVSQALLEEEHKALPAGATT